MSGPTPPHPRLSKFWCGVVRPLLPRQRTPFFLFSPVPIRAALRELDEHFGRLPVRHWLSCKTQPLRPLLQWWRRQGRPIEVVSEFEFRAARAEGFPAEHLLVNGPAKHHWLPPLAIRGLRVNLDSVAEARVLAPLAKRLGWTIGVRVNTQAECDPESPEHPTQFGLGPEELPAALVVLQRHGLRPEIVHFHLRTNVAAASVYEGAWTEVAEICRDLGLRPRILDCGGGFPPPGVLTRDGSRVDASFKLAEMRGVCERALQRFPAAEEIWFENGRWLTARSGVLVVKILDVKERRGMRSLICDGGRTLNALVSNWEAHAILPLEPRRGPGVLTTVHGPTCMAFDQLGRLSLPRSLRAGDHLVWCDAGAYHLPWETRFSHGLAAVLWHDGRRVTRARERESFEEWWGV